MSDILTPLPQKLRPTSVEDILGQKKILSYDGVLSRIIKKKILSSFILWGPPGCGKTTIAKAISNELDIETYEISAVLSGVKDLRIIFEKGERNFSNGKQTILFVDEIHRFNKGQQDSFLPYLEKGIVCLIGATTENPSFSIISALLSRCQVIKLEKLSNNYLMLLKIKAEKHYGFVTLFLPGHPWPPGDPPPQGTLPETPPETPPDTHQSPPETSLGDSQSLPENLMADKNPFFFLKIGMNGFVMSPHGLIFDEDEATGCPMPQEPFPTPFRLVLGPF